jgi:hypothetical protein
VPPPEELLDAFRRGQRLFVLPEWKLAYVSVPKNACTSIKWLIAELGGEDLEALRRGGLNFSPTLDGKIHNRERWQVVPTLDAVDQTLWEQIKHDDDWMVFGVLRDPRLRLFSAWQDKYLLRNPGYWRSWVESERPLPTSFEQVAADFAEFCRAMAADPRHPARRDGHFRSQTKALRTDVVPYRRLYDMSELGELMNDLNEHLTGLGHPGGLVLGRSHSSPFKPCGALFENGVREDIEKIYAADFAQFGDRWDFREVEERPVSWTAESFAHAHALVDVHERLTEVIKEARRQRRRVAKVRKRAVRLRRRLRAEQRRNQALQGQVRHLENSVAGEAGSRTRSVGRRVLRRAARVVRRG